MKTEISDQLRSELVSSLLNACRDDRREDIDLLFSLGVNIDATNDFFLGMTPLMVALHNEHRVLASELIDRGADVSKSSAGGVTPLMEATKIRGFLWIIEKILEKGGEINAVDEENETPLFFALERRNFEVAWKLVEKGAYVDVTNKGGRSPFDICAYLSTYDSRFAALQDFMLKKGRRKSVEA